MNPKVRFSILVIVAFIELFLVGILLFRYNTQPNGHESFLWQLVSNVLILIALIVQSYRAYRSISGNKV
ncbi:hypothetical protein [Dyadobacter sp. SG02]|uniref:hypothetical protein n=1 Tax=Dyadobacter sp. SG02 TaxID=1855291 RepID=UPI000B82422F|nr:hypothetical protein [Dyadobacter sp. SG02]